MTYSQELLNIGVFVERSSVNGPGSRAVVWLQGCQRHCPGCANPQFWDTSAGDLITADELAQRILAVHDIEGVTYTGGEPFLQAQGLHTLSGALRAAGLSIVCFSDYRIEELSQMPVCSLLLSDLDVLVDGEFRLEKRQPLLWRGSSNQRVHFLTERYRDYHERLDEPWREFEIHIVNGQLLVTGFLGDEVRDRLVRSLRDERDLIMRPDNV